MQTLIIPVEGEPRWEDPEEINYPYLKNAVGGYFEVIGFQEKPVNMYLNEEGKLEGLPKNRLATLFARNFTGIGLGDYIAGDAVLVGPTDEEGYDIGIDPETRKWIEEWIGKWQHG